MGNIAGIGSDIIVSVQTGSRKGAGTDASVWFVARDEAGHASEEIKLNSFFEKNFELGKLDTFKIARRQFSSLTSPVDKIEIWRDYTGLLSTWFVETVVVEDPDYNVVYEFPVYRWIRPSYKYVIQLYDTSLPQEDPATEQRELELDEARRTYKLANGDPTLPVQVVQLPDDEEYPVDFKRENIKEMIDDMSSQLRTDRWSSLADIQGIYATEDFYIPECYKYWREDWYFGHQRLNGVNPGIIKLCHRIPKKLAVNDSMLKQSLEGQSIKTAIKNKKIFICDLDIFHNFTCPNQDDVVCAPIAMFYLNKKEEMVPIAIQLFQEPGEDNPVFLPSDDEYTWLMAKMWYNNAEAIHHLAFTYLGCTCLLMEGVALSLQRHLSKSHPIHKMLLPFFTNLMAANNDIMQNLMTDGGLMDKILTVGSRGVKKIIRRGLQDWRMDTHGCLPEDLMRREVQDTRVLPGYSYRDDGMLLYYAIRNYVIKYVTLYYEDSVVLQGDRELQAWSREMATSREQGGMGLPGLPYDDVITKFGQLQDVLTSVIFTCTVQQAAVGSAMYDMYGFPPNYPLRLEGKPPCDKSPLSETDILSALRTSSWTEGMTLALVLSDPVNKGLGKMDGKYIYDPRAVDIHDKFRAEVEEIGKVIREKNMAREHSYHYLFPSAI